MRLPASCSTSIRRVGVITAVVGLGLVAFGPTASASSPADITKHKATIDTYTGWPGNSSIYGLGCPNSTVYGTTITVPAKKHHIKKFVFYMNDGGAIGSMVVRGEIYAWNGTMATGANVAETAPVTVDLPDSDWHGITFKFPKNKVKPGSQYVVFASTDKDYEQCSNYAVSWGGADDGTYPGGTFVYQNNSGDENNWTTQPMNTIGQDAVMQGYLTK
jgi:hypothetical protein